MVKDLAVGACDPLTSLILWCCVMSEVFTAREGYCLRERLYVLARRACRCSSAVISVPGLTPLRSMRARSSACTTPSVWNCWLVPFGGSRALTLADGGHVDAGLEAGGRRRLVEPRDGEALRYASGG